MVEVDLPGIDPAVDLEIHVLNNVLRIEGEKCETHAVDEADRDPARAEAPGEGPSGRRIRSGPGGGGLRGCAVLGARGRRILRLSLNPARIASKQPCSQNRHARNRPSFWATKESSRSNESDISCP